MSRVWDSEMTESDWNSKSKRKWYEFEIAGSVRQQSSRERGCSTVASILLQLFQLIVAFQQYCNSQEGDNPVT